jgi:putative acetyltransferase
MEAIRPAGLRDVSRIAEILIFAKRCRYRDIFCNDRVSFGEMQVLPLAEEYLSGARPLEMVWVYDDEFVKGMIHVERGEVMELYVDPFFQGRGIGSALLAFAIREREARRLWVLEKNRLAVAFYGAHGFTPTGGRTLEPGTPEYLLELARTE